MLSQDHVIHRIGADDRQKFVKELRIKFSLEAEQNVDFSGVFFLQRQDRCDIVLKLLLLQMKPGGIAVGIAIRRMLGKAERPDAAADGGFDVFPLGAAAVAIAEGVRVIVAEHDKPQTETLDRNI